MGTSTDYHDVALQLAPVLEAEAERNDPLSTTVVDAMYDSGLYATAIPREVGGLELDVLSSIDVYAALAYANGSAGWCLMASTTAASYFGAWCDETLVDAMFGPGIPKAAGQFAPKGVGVPENGGYRITGSYQFGSGINDAEWVGAGVLTEADAPQYRFVITPRDNANVTGNWDVMGLQATASYDYELQDVYVPEGATFDFSAPVRHRGGAMYDMGVLPLTASGHAGFGIGVVRRALDELIDKAAGGHQRMAGRTPLADSERLQHDLGVLESRFRAAELWVRDSFARAEASCVAGNPDPAALLECRQATTFITQEGGDIVREAYLHAGTLGLREGALNRCFRDIHAGTQHAVVSPMATMEFATHLIDEARG